MDRREVLKGAAGMSVAMATAAGEAQAQPKAAKPATFVLVHGAWHGGWCWSRMTPPLEAAGHRVFTPTMTGLGERKHLANLQIDLDTHTTDILNVLDWEELSDVVLVGHSYAGYIITQVAERAKPGQVKRLVYLDAVVPTHGKAFADGFPPERIRDTEANLIDGYGMAIGTPEFLGIPKEDEETRAWLARRLVPHPWGTMLQKANFPENKAAKLPRTYIRCKAAFSDEQLAQRDAAIRADKRWEYVLMDTGHNAMMTKPQETAALLLART
jgi:pimeloyl-ACP methyl ester carboxylesterase